MSNKTTVGEVIAPDMIEKLLADPRSRETAAMLPRLASDERREQLGSLEALGQIQTAYGREDLGTLRRLVTPEMLSYFSEDLAANASRGVRNEISDVQLLQGDLAEAWSEGATQYATLAMRFSLNDRLVSRDNGQMVEGGPQEVTELWTFMRSRGGHWILSAIQAA